MGTRLLDLFREDSEYRCSNLDLQPSHFFNEITVLGDVRNQQDVDDFLAGADMVVLLAAQHRDDVTPISLYYDTNVKGMEVTLRAMEKNNVRRIVFFSSVAVYGINKDNPDENHPADPFNHYGKSKWQAEEVLRRWYQSHPDWNINIVRPTVIFGERNRGNVYNLLKQLSSGHFLMVGKGTNRKSMSYVGNVTAFVKFVIDNLKEGYNVYNYIDKPDKDMNELIGTVSKVFGKRMPSTHFPYWLGMIGGYGFDVLSFLTRKKFAISSVRVKKFCATTVFNSDKSRTTGFIAPYTLEEGLERTLRYEFINPHKDDITFKSE